MIVGGSAGGRVRPSRALWSSVGRVAAAAGASFAAAVVAAITLAVTDLYVTGHGHPSLMRAWIDWEAGGVHLSRADVGILAVAMAAGVASWQRLRR
ncbi:MAG: hypothetical protein QOD06_431 [Candidatus Binatota bacterium]|nr:hypothetical protein [Candidatus Binatota bacterium]